MISIPPSPHLLCAGSIRVLCGTALVLALGQMTTRAEKPKPAAPAPVVADAAPAEVVIPKSVFVDDPATGKDPFFPRSDRRLKALAKVASSNPVVPSTTLFSQLTLKGVSTAKNHRLALINGTTFAAGELIEMKIGARTFQVRCREIRDNSVIVSIEGVNETKELKLREGI